MNTPSPDQIAVRAYALWENAGRPDGRDVEFWLNAERELGARRRSSSSRVGSAPPFAAASGNPAPASAGAESEPTTAARANPPAAAEAGPASASREAPPVSNLERTLPPGERHRARAARHGDSGQAPAPPVAEHFIAVADRAHLRLYRVTAPAGANPRYEPAGAFDFPAGRQRANANESDQAGRFPATRGLAGGSIDERLPMQNEHERRVVTDVATQLEQFFAARPKATWDLVASSDVQPRLLERLSDGVQRRLEIRVMKDLVNQTPEQLHAHLNRAAAEKRESAPAGR